jgi:hypothetical protein
MTEREIPNFPILTAAFGEVPPTEGALALV